MLHLLVLLLSSSPGYSLCHNPPAQRSRIQPFDSTTVCLNYTLQFLDDLTYFFGHAFLAITTLVVDRTICSICMRPIYGGVSCVHGSVRRRVSVGAAAGRLAAPHFSGAGSVRRTPLQFRVIANGTLD